MPKEQTEHRKYIRLNSCFPVEFSLYFTLGKPASKEYQGFTCDVSNGGLCIRAKNLKPEDAEAIASKKPHLALSINIPLSSRPIEATAVIAWSRKDDKDPTKKTDLIGVSYNNIKEEDRRRIISYARRIKWIPRITSILLLLLFL